MKDRIHAHLHDILQAAQSVKGFLQDTTFEQ